MRRIRILTLMAVLLLGLSSAQAVDFSIGIGSGDYYVNVGDYDYLPYTIGQPGYGYGTGYGNPALNFNMVLGDYGDWVSFSPFGRVWRPYTYAGWRPYTYGHWDYTQYGPQWTGYEPWAWAGYHYGNWVFAPNMGWVWVPGYQWHPGQVAWGQSYGSIGWMPRPPSGYDYSRGYISFVGPTNQFSYYDNDFGIGFGDGGYYDYGGPYYDPRYRSMYYNNSALNLLPVLWTFIDAAFFSSDNYADYVLAPDYSRYAFDQRLVRVSSRPIERTVMERIVRTRIVEQPVQEKEVQIDNKRVKVVTVQGEEEKVRKHANEVVKEVIAPAFVEKRKNFKGDKAKNHGQLVKALKIENAPRQVQTVSGDQLIREAEQKKQTRQTKNKQNAEVKKQEVAKIEKEGKVREKKGRGPEAAPGKIKRQEETTQEQEQQDLKNKQKQETETKTQDQDLKREQRRETETTTQEQPRGKREREEETVTTEPAKRQGPEDTVTEKPKDEKSAKQQQEEKQKKAKSKQQKDKDKDKDKQQSEEEPDKER
jgi:hypothetical protein